MGHGIQGERDMGPHRMSIILTQLMSSFSSFFRAFLEPLTACHSLISQMKNMLLKIFCKLMEILKYLQKE